MAQIKFRVQTEEELKSIIELVDFNYDVKKSIRTLVEELEIEDCDVQFVNKVLIITGNIKTMVFSLYNSYLPIQGFEININDSLIKVIFDCSKIALPGGVNNIALQLLVGG